MYLYELHLFTEKNKKESSIKKDNSVLNIMDED
jgi:hypothetical protein